MRYLKDLKLKVGDKIFNKETNTVYKILYVHCDRNITYSVEYYYNKRKFYCILRGNAKRENFAIVRE
jgi:hypothetical protein